MKSAGKAEPPEDRKGRPPHIGDEASAPDGTEPVAQGDAIGMTPACPTRGIRSADPHMGAIGDRRYRTGRGGLDPHGPERIEAGGDGRREEAAVRRMRKRARWRRVYGSRQLAATASPQDDRHVFHGQSPSPARAPCR